MFHGPTKARWAAFPDLSPSEVWMLAPATALMFVLGIHPQLVIGVINRNRAALGRAAGAWLNMIAWTIYLSFGGAAVLALLPRGQAWLARWIALGTVLAGAAAAFGGAFQYRAGSGLQTIARTAWLPSWGIDYHLAVGRNQRDAGPAHGGGGGGEASFFVEHRAAGEGVFRVLSGADRRRLRRVSELRCCFCCSCSTRLRSFRSTS